MRWLLMKKSQQKDRRHKGEPQRPFSRPTPLPEERRPRFSRTLSILYEDDAVVVLDKPSGMLAVPIKGSHTPSAWSLLAERLERKKQQAFIVHRIDRFSSGALLFAKTGPDRHSLVQQVLAHTPTREYLTVVRGRVEQKTGTLVHHFEREGMFQQLRSARDRQATRAELRYSVERWFPNASLIRVELVTGLQNQIRAQFSAIGHPVVGDRKFHREEAMEPLIDRVALHAAHLEFVHPRSGERISVDCKLPSDMRHLIQELSRRPKEGEMQPKPVEKPPVARKHRRRR